MSIEIKKYTFSTKQILFDPTTNTSVVVHQSPVLAELQTSKHVQERELLQSQVSNMNHCRLVGKNGELRVRTENVSPRNFKPERTIMSCTGATCPATLAQPLVRRERCEPRLDRAHPGVCLFDKSLHPLHMYVGHLDGLLLDLAGLRRHLLLR